MRLENGNEEEDRAKRQKKNRRAGKNRATSTISRTREKLNWILQHGIRHMAYV